MIICCGMFRIFWKNKRLHLKFRPYKYRKKLMNTEQKEQDMQELKLYKENLSNIMHEMQELCEQVKHPDPEMQS